MESTIPQSPFSINNTQQAVSKGPKQIVVPGMIVDRMDGGEVSEGEWVSLVRFRSKYDNNAIRVNNKAGEKVGYIEASLSAILSPLMDRDLIRLHARVYEGCNKRTTPVIIFVCGDAEDVDRVYMPPVENEADAEIDCYSECETGYDSNAESEAKSTVERVQNEMSTLMREHVDLRRRLEQIEHSTKQNQKQEVHFAIITDSTIAATTSPSTVSLGAGLNTNSEEMLELADSWLSSQANRPNGELADSILTEPLDGEAIRSDLDSILPEPLDGEVFRSQSINGQDMMETAMSIITSEV